MRSMVSVKIAISGAGMIGKRHIDLVNENPKTALLAIVDPAPAAIEVAEMNKVPLFKTLDELFAKTIPDGVIVATPDKTHVEQGLACVAAGVPALVEKPIAHSIEAGEALVRAADKAGVRLLAGHHRQHSPIMQRAVEVVKSGRLGRLVAVVGSAMFYKPEKYFQDAPWRKEAGNGPIPNNMVHEVGNMRALCGEIVEVQAAKSHQTRNTGAEDTAAILMRFANGALGTFVVSDVAAAGRSWEQTSTENRIYATYPDEDAYVVSGTDGSLSIPTMRLKTFANPEERSWFNPMKEETITVERSDPLAHQLDNFIAVIRGESEPIVSARDGLANVRVIDAIVKATRTNAVVKV